MAMVFKFWESVVFYFRYMARGFANGGSWKISRITSLEAPEIRKIMVRNFSTYEDLFFQQERTSH